MTLVRYTMENVLEGDNTIYLAGPSLRPGQEGTSWRKEAIEALTHFFHFEGTILVPEYRDGKQPEGWTYSKQVSWETENLRRATVILFWIPRDLESLPGFTTNIELGEWLSSGKIVCGAPEGAPKVEYIKERCFRMGIPWTSTLRGCLQNALTLMKENFYKIWFTADTHFGSTRTLELSKRPFKSVEEMDWEMVARWNALVSKRDVVYHLGDFGNPEMLWILNFGEMHIIPGNYERENEHTVHELSRCSRVRMEPDGGGVLFGLYGLVHEPVMDPSKFADAPEFWLFGHIHKLQMVKRNGLNVGVDCHDFKPIDIPTVEFYRNAVQKHYDENVFIGAVGAE